MRGNKMTWAAGVLCVLAVLTMALRTPEAEPAAFDGSGGGEAHSGGRTGGKARSELPKVTGIFPGAGQEALPGSDIGAESEYPPDAVTVEMLVADGRRSSSGWTVILQSSKSQKMFGKYTTPEGTQVLLVPSSVWSELPDKKVLGKRVSAICVPMVDSDSTWKVLALQVLPGEVLPSPAE